MGQKIKFYTDEHVAKAVVKGLRQRGVDVRTVMDAGMLAASDQEHLALARSEGRVISRRMTIFCACMQRALIMLGLCMRLKEYRLARSSSGSCLPIRCWMPRT